MSMNNPESQEEADYYAQEEEEEQDYQASMADMEDEEHNKMMNKENIRKSSKIAQEVMDKQFLRTAQEVLKKKVKNEK